MPRMDALDRAIAEFGTQEKFAAALGIKSPSVSEWRTRGRIPFDRCKDIVRVTKGAVRLDELCPDMARAFAQAHKRSRKAA